MSRKTAENGIMFVENIYNPSILSVFKKEEKSLKPFIVINIEGTDYFITDKNRFLKTISKYERKIKKVGIEKGWIVLYIEGKVVKYEIIPTNLKIKKL